MKATKSQVERIAAGFRRLWELCPTDMTVRRQQHSAERYRWDCFWAMHGLDIGRNLSSDLYQAGLTDRHIDTALRAAMRIVEKERTR